MDLSRIEQFVKQSGEKFVIVENGEPEMVVMSFQEYAKLMNGGRILPADASGEVNSALEQKIFKSEIKEGTEFAVNEEKEDTEFTGTRLENVRLEDLPL